MIFIPGWLITAITFPGVIVHEMAHRFFCDLTKVDVYEVNYFNFGNPAGYVLHGPVNGLKKSFLISVGPLVINTILCVLLTSTAIFPIMIFDETHYDPLLVFPMWLGISIGMHAFPSNDDLENFVTHVKNNKKGIIFLIIAKIFASIFKITNALKVFWFDAIYAFGISMLLPTLIKELC